jgi:multidrug transporter EmrE-like cation transporter
MLAAFAMVQAPFTNADAQTFLRVIATAMAARSMCWANAAEHAQSMPMMMASATMWIPASVNTTNAASATEVVLSLDTIAMALAWPILTATGFATDLKSRVALMQQPATTTRTLRTTMVLAFMQCQDWIAQEVACLTKTMTAFAIKTKPQAARTNPPAIMT